MSTFRWGIFGTGSISTKFLAGLASARDARVTVVASRSFAKADAFARATGVDTAVAGYAEAARQGGMDAAYIATPPAKHAEHAIACLEAGLPVLVEKPFATTAQDAQRIVDAARAHSVFAMEAMWTRFLPAAQAMRERVLSGEIGNIRLVSGNFGMAYVPDPANGMFDATLGGGALAHLGAYPLSLAQWLFGTPTVVQAMGRLGETGVDEDVAFQLEYPAKVLGSFFASLRAWAPDEFRIMGESGMISTRGSVVRPYGLDVAREAPRGLEQADFGWRAGLRQNRLVHQVAQRIGRSSRSRGAHHAHRYVGNGYHYEADEVRTRVEQREIESTVMPLADSVAVARTMDTIRAAVQERSTTPRDGRE